MGADWTSLNHDWKAGMPEDQEVIVTGHLLLKEFDFLVVKRPGYEVPTSPGDPTGLRAFGPRLFWLEMKSGMHFVEGNLSSTELRKRVDNVSYGAIDGHVPPGVYGYICR